MVEEGLRPPDTLDRRSSLNLSISVTICDRRKWEMFESVENVSPVFLSPFEEWGEGDGGHVPPRPVLSTQV